MASYAGPSTSVPVAPRGAAARVVASDETAGDEGVSESLSKQVFARYVCRSSCEGKGVLHPGDIAEAGSLSAVPLPKTEHPLWDALPEDVVLNGKLSQLQLEGVLYACTKHQQILPSGERAGFMIGDGAGVGKGRQIAGVIIDSWARGRRRHVWLSISTDLHLDAERDFRDLGCYIQVINNCQTLDKESKALGLSKDFKEGVLFMTYSTLIGNMRGRSRLQQVIDWLGGEAFNGCIVFDECHKAKNFSPGKESGSTKAAACTIDLQARLPMARVLYCSATGVSEVGNMAYMVRMGLFGQATAFPDFQSFLDSMKKRGVSFMEMLAMEMKAEGKYVARGLSFKDAEFVDLEAPLTARQVAVYDAASGLWQSLRQQLEDAMARTNCSARDVWRPFWAAQQRFFKLLCIRDTDKWRSRMKIPMVVAEAKAALMAGQCVVIGLQTTGEASTDSLSLVPGPCPGFVSTCAELLSRFILTHFPTRMGAAEDKQRRQSAADQEVPLVEGEEDDEGGAAEASLVTPSAVAAAAGEEVAECLTMRAQLLQRVDELQLPPNFLDQLIDELGGTAQVAELTGRHGRIVRDGRGHARFELRAKPDSSEMDSLNVREKERFMKGEKLVAVISDAASTGISLHASRRAANQRRRVHITIELPWSADKAIQQLGRSHRSNQVTGPIYKLVSTRLGGEKRFAAAVARRLQSLGALTRGDRRAASGIDLSEQNFDSPLGRKSLRRLYDHIVLDSPTLPAGVQLADVRRDAMDPDGAESKMLYSSEDKHMEAIQVAQLHAQLRQHCELMGIGLGVTLQRQDTVTEDKVPRETGKDSGDVRRFLNRILGLPVAPQNLLFNYFAATLTAEIRAAKAEGKYSEGLADLFGTKIQLLATTPLWTDPASRLKTYTNVFNIDRGLCFEDAVARLAREAMPGDGSSFYRSRKPQYGRHMTLLALHKQGSKGTFHISRPNTGDSYFDIERDELEAKYVCVSAEEVQEEWRAMYVGAAIHCLHGLGCTLGPGCAAGMRMTQVTILSGSVVRVWGVLEAVLHRHETELSKMDRTMRVVRVEIEGGRHLVGVRYPSALLPEVVLQLSLAAQAQQQAQQQQGHQSALQGAVAVPLAAVPLISKGRVEPPAPIDKKSLAKAFTKPKTIQVRFGLCDKYKLPFGFCHEDKEADLEMPPDQAIQTHPQATPRPSPPAQPTTSPSADLEFIDISSPTASGTSGSVVAVTTPGGTEQYGGRIGAEARQEGQVGLSGRTLATGGSSPAVGLQKSSFLMSGVKREAAAAAASEPSAKRVPAAQTNLFSVLKDNAAKKTVPAPKTAGAKGGLGRPGAGALRGSSAAEQAARKRLVSMGFAAEQVERALWETGGNEQRAVELCLVANAKC